MKNWQVTKHKSKWNEDQIKKSNKCM